LITDDIFYTKTMAKVYADQGQLDKAVEIYRFLLNEEPERQDLIDALAEIDRKRYAKDPEGLSQLFGTWIDLVLVYNSLQKLKKIKRLLK